MGVRLAVAALVNSVFINVQENIAAGAGQIKQAYFLPIANYRQFILNQYQKVGEKPANTATPKKKVKYHSPPRSSKTNSCGKV